MTMRIRAAGFSLFYYLFVFWFGLTGALLWWLPYRYRSQYITLWNHAIVIIARIFIGIKINIVGKENITAMHRDMHNYVILSKHQSEWETFFLPTLFYPVCTILKKELLRIPFFGWALKQMEPIAIDRASPKDALKQVQNEGLARLKQGRSVLIFPEGTRVAPGASGRYAKSGANLALAAGKDILPVAHNAGICWPHRGKKTAGTITFVIGEAIKTENRTARDLTAEVELWIEQQSQLLLDQTNSYVAAN